MSEALILALIRAVCEAFADEAYRQMTSAGLHVGGDTIVSYGVYVVGTGQYDCTWTSDFSSFTETCVFHLSDSYLSDVSSIPFVSGEHVEWFVGGEGATAAESILSIVNSSYYSLKLDTVGYSYYCVINGGGASQSVPAGSYVFISTSAPTPNYYVNPSGGGDRPSGTDPQIVQITSIISTSSQTVSSGYPDAVYVPVPSGGTITYNDYRQYVIEWANNRYDLRLTINDAPEFSEFYEIETESESEAHTGCCCDCTTIYVNADGSLTLTNEISGDMPINIDNNADLSLNVTAAAGAFGAGAIVIDPDANINIDASAFASGAFGAGAIVSPDVSVSGSVEIGDISGEVSLNASDISISGGDINIDQSGSTITNNYYYDPSEPEKEPFTIDYDEILSESELESILNQETYDIVISTDSNDVISVSDTIPDNVGELILLPSEVVSASSAVVGYGSQIISDLGLMPIYAPLALFSCFCWMIRGGK